MRLPELFSGSGYVGRAFKAYGFEVESLDKRPDYNPTICVDILEWDYTCFPKGSFDAIWASPDCTQYPIARSNAKTPRNLEYADSLVQKALEIIEYFKPRAWFLDNPASGLLKTRVFMHLIPCVTVSYCKYGAKFQKHTMLWGPSCITIGAPNVDATVGASWTVSTQPGCKREPKGRGGMITPKYNCSQYLRRCA